MAKIIPGGIKDANGIFIREPAKNQAPEAIESDDITIDDLLKAGLQNIRGILRSITQQVGINSFDRETVMNLKDVMTMLHELKKKEQELLESLTDEQLKEMLKK